jgi:hypothetical protein
MFVAALCNLSRCPLRLVLQEVIAAFGDDVILARESRALRTSSFSSTIPP